MLFHASPTAGITMLEPRVSNHGTPLVYFSAKRENVLVYLSNAVEKFCRETGFPCHGPLAKWGPYGFNKAGIQQIDEYYPNALEETYKGVSGYIYCVESVTDPGPAIEIPGAVTSRSPVPVLRCEFVEDALEEILRAEADGLLVVRRYAELNEDTLRWVSETVRKEYENPENTPEYRYFLKAKFGIN